MSDIREILMKIFSKVAIPSITGSSGLDELYSEFEQAILDWHKAELERVIGEDENIDTMPDGTRWLNRAIPKQKNQLRAEQRKRGKI